MHNTLIFQKVVPSYRVAVFKELYYRYGIVTCHSKERKGSTWRSFHTEMDFPNELVARRYYRNNDSAIVQNIIAPLRKYKPKVVIAEYSIANMSFWLLLFLRFIFGYKLIIWGHGVKNREIFSPFKSKSSKISRWAYNRANALIIYTNERAKLIRENINTPEKVFVAQNTLDTKSIELTRQQLSGKIPQEKSFQYGFNLLYVGRLLKSKGIADLLAAFDLLKEEQCNVSLHIIGEGPELGMIEQYREKYSDIHYHGGIYNETELAKKIMQSALLINPGYLGLSVVHALGYGCPVVAYKNTPKGPFHSPEYEYIIDGFNGYFIAHSPVAIKEIVMELINKPQETDQLKKNAIKSLETICPFSKMINGFEEALEYVKDK